MRKPGKKIDVIHISAASDYKIDLRFDGTQMRFYAELRGEIYEAKSPAELKKQLEESIRAFEKAQLSFKRWICLDVDFIGRSYSNIYSFNGYSQETRRPGEKFNSWRGEMVVAGVTFAARVVEIADAISEGDRRRLIRRVVDDPETGELEEPKGSGEVQSVDPEGNPHEFIPYTEQRWKHIVKLRTQLYKLYSGLEELFSQEPQELIQRIDQGWSGVPQLAAPSKK